MKVVPLYFQKVYKICEVCNGKKQIEIEIKQFGINEIHKDICKECDDFGMVVSHYEHKSGLKVTNFWNEHGILYGNFDKVVKKI